MPLTHIQWLKVYATCILKMIVLVWWIFKLDHISGRTKLKLGKSSRVSWPSIVFIHETMATFLFSKITSGCRSPSSLSRCILINDNLAIPPESVKLWQDNRKLVVTCCMTIKMLLLKWCFSIITSFQCNDLADNVYFLPFIQVCFLVWLSV